LSLIIDIDFISNSFIPDTTASSSASVIRAVRAARLGARYGRLMRLIRILRVVKKLNLCGRDSEEYEPTMKAIKKVSEDLSMILSLRIAILVVFLIIIIPFLNYIPDDASYNTWVLSFRLAAKNPNVTMENLQHLGWKCWQFYHEKNSRLTSIYVESPYLPSPYYSTYETRKILRQDNIHSYNSPIFLSNSTLASSGNNNAMTYLENSVKDGRNSRYGYTEFPISLKFDFTVPNEFNALYNILVIVLTIIVLFTFTESFNEAIGTLVVRPLEKMMMTLRNSAMNMLTTLKSLEDAQKGSDGEERGGENKDTTAVGNGGDGNEGEGEEEELEGAMLEKIVEKLTRVVKHIIPNQATAEIEKNQNIDSSTANWLNSAFSLSLGIKQLGNTHRAESIITDEAAENVKQKTLEESLSLEIRKSLSNGWEFNVLSYSVNELHKIVFYLFLKCNLIEEFNIPEPVLRTFIVELSSKYLNNSYHNYKHGVDVFFTVYRLTTVTSLTAIFSPLEFLGLLVGALSHDVGHMGLNNVYLVKAKHNLAILHNDRSPLENMHCTLLYDLLTKETTNIFVNLNEKEWRSIRKIIITVILGTDMSHHFEQISKTQVRKSEWCFFFASCLFFFSFRFRLLSLLFLPCSRWL
jgi:uncharacterized protein YggT (Ycf19 family)